jgi:hypothetical protein
MFDVIFVTLAVAFFVLCAGYVAVCDWLMTRGAGRF